MYANDLMRNGEIQRRKEKDTENNVFLCCLLAECGDTNERFLHSQVIRKGKFLYF